MIFFIIAFACIFLGLILIFSACFYIENKKVSFNKPDLENGRGLTGLIMTLVSGFTSLLLLLIMGCFRGGSDSKCKEWSEAIKDSQADAVVLLSALPNHELKYSEKYQCSYYLVKADDAAPYLNYILKYNENIFEVEKGIYDERNLDHNSWTNWFTTDAYTRLDGYNKNAKVYTSILTSVQSIQINDLAWLGLEKN